MTSPAVKMPQIVYAKSHETATWNVWIAHKVKCRICVHGGEGVQDCLEGSNAYEEWIIAISRLRDLLP